MCIMNDMALNSQAEADDFTDELTDEALDRAIAASSVPTYGCNFTGGP